MKTVPSAPRRARRVASRAVTGALLGTILTALLAGCGSSHSDGTNAEPAQVTPASAALYAGADVQPTGDRKDAAVSAGRRLTHQADPYLKLLAALQTPGSGTLDYGKDVEPWLGHHAGAFVTSLTSSGPLVSTLEQGLLGGSPAAFPFGSGAAQGAIVLDTSDTGKASSFLHSQAQRAGAHETSYRGVAYEISSGGVTFGLVHKFAVIGSESGMHAVIDTALGGPSLASSSEYSRLSEAAPTGALAHVFASATAAHAAGAEASGLIQAITGEHAANVSFVPSPGAIGLDADTLHDVSGNASPGLLSADPQAAAALNELPGESWLAVGLGHISGTLGRDVNELEGLATFAASLGGSEPEAAPDGLSLKGLIDGLLEPLRVLGANTPEAHRQFASWMNTAGVFASGNGLAELRLGIVITSHDAALSKAAVPELAAMLHKQGGNVQPVTLAGTEAAVAVGLQGLPLMLDIAAGHASNGQAKLVIGFGEASTQIALNPTSTLASSAVRTSAAAALGEGIEPSIIADFPTFLGLLEGVGLGEDPSISKIAPYLRASTMLSGGGRQLASDLERFRLVLGLQPESG